MISKRFFVLFSLLVLSTASPINNEIRWGKCPDNSSEAQLASKSEVHVECGMLRVPLDYSQPESHTVHHIFLVKVPAPKQPAKGSIQLNFGGPGYPATASLISQAADLQALTGGLYDLVTFDPRGVSYELPFVCTEDPYVIGQILATLSDLSLSDRDSRSGWAIGGLNAAICKREGLGNSTAELIGTAFMARDVERVAKAIDKDGLIRWWGFSYGTTLGSTIAAIFPERVDRMILDGIQNPHLYYNGWTDSELWTDTDKAVEFFFESCVDAGPEKCALAAATNRTGHEMANDFFQLVESVIQSPILIPESGAIVNGMLPKSMIFSALYSTAGWPAFAAGLVPVLYGTPEERIAAFRQLTALPEEAPPPSLEFTERNWGIHCGDRTPRTDSYEEIEPALHHQFNTSYWAGGLNAASQTTCAQWPWKAKEIYSGDFQVKTKHPILIMGNSLDAHTPIITAKNVSSGFEGSVILENDGVGHCVNSYPSICAAKHMIEYWVNGNLPPADTICKPELGAWDPKSWLDSVAGKPEVTKEFISAQDFRKGYDEKKTVPEHIKSLVPLFPNY